MWRRGGGEANWLKTALLARVRLLLFGVVVHLSATAVHGTQQEVDNLSEAVWRTILRGPRPPATAWPRASSRVGATKFASHQSPNPLPKKARARVNHRSQTP